MRGSLKIIYCVNQRYSETFPQVGDFVSKKS